MKKLFTLIASRLKTVPGIKWIDLDKGQLNNYEVRPPIAFPGVLVKIDYVQAANQNSTVQQVAVRITLRIAWDFHGHTDSTMAPDQLAANLAYFDFVEDVYKAFQGYRDNTVIRSPFRRANQVEETRPDGLKVVALTLLTDVLDTSAE